MAWFRFLDDKEKIGRIGAITTDTSTVGRLTLKKVTRLKMSTQN